MKRFNVGDLRLEKKELEINLGKHNYIFVGSSTDMFAQVVPSEWISKVLVCCNNPITDNTYLFQSKNPMRFVEFLLQFPKQSILGTTIESDIDYADISLAPSVTQRCEVMSHLAIRKMVSIEPILDFDIDRFVSMLHKIQPEFVSIGADSGRNNLPEPSPEKIGELILKLKEFTTVKIKENLNRLLMVK
jgi:protein gp37